MFHGQVGLGGGADNRVKSIQTRSGHKVIFTEDESIIITDKSGNEIHLDTTGSNINITAPETMTLNCKNMNINVSDSMTSTIGNNQSTSVGQNKSNTVGMSQTEVIGAIKSVTVGGNFMTNVIGKMMEFIKGNKESHTESDRLKITNGKITIQSTGIHEQHSEDSIANRAAEKSKNH